MTDDDEPRTITRDSQPAPESVAEDAEWTLIGDDASAPDRHALIKAEEILVAGGADPLIIALIRGIREGASA